jgi:hypothetical protein
MWSSWADQNGKDLFLSDVQKQDHLMFCCANHVLLSCL